MSKKNKLKYVQPVRQVQPVQPVPVQPVQPVQPMLPPISKNPFPCGIDEKSVNSLRTLPLLQSTCTSNQKSFVVYTEEGEKDFYDLHLATQSTGRYSYDDRGLSNLFADCHLKDLRYVPEDKCYYAYDGRRWIEGNEKAAEHAKEFAEWLLEYKKFVIGYKEFNLSIKKLQTTRARENLLKDAKSVHPIHKSEFDKNPYLLNCLNGVLDLKTGMIHPHNPDDKLSKLANVEFVLGARCLRWERHIEEVTNGDKALAEYLQKCFGYALTGNSRFECCFMLYGCSTRNGKTTTLTPISKLLGDYSCNVQPDTIASKSFISGSSHSDDVARMAGSRFISISEPGKKLPLDAAMVKVFTGGNTITARAIYKSNFEFKLNAKIFLDTNHLPLINDPTVFTSNRIKVIPFMHRFVGNTQDKFIKEELCRPENLSGILNWCMEGLRLLEANGFDEPPAVVEATEKYAKESDKIGRFIDEFLVEDPQMMLLTDEVYAEYRSWCNMNGNGCESQQNFNTGMEAHNILNLRKRPSDKRYGTNPRNHFIGVGWKAPHKYLDPFATE